MEKCVINQAQDGAAEISFDGLCYLRTVEGKWFCGGVNLSDSDEEGGDWDLRSLSLMLESLLSLANAVDHLSLWVSNNE